MKKLSLLWMLSIGMLLFACGGDNEGTEETNQEEATAQVTADHACCSPECGDDCEVHAEEKKTCKKDGNIANCDHTKCDKSQCDKLAADKKECDMSKCDPSKCQKASTDDIEEEDETAIEVTTAA